MKKILFSVLALSLAASAMAQDARTPAQQAAIDAAAAKVIESFRPVLADPKVQAAAGNSEALVKLMPGYATAKARIQVVRREAVERPSVTSELAAVQAGAPVRSVGASVNIHFIFTPVRW